MTLKKHNIMKNIEKVLSSFYTSQLRLTSLSFVIFYCVAYMAGISLIAPRSIASELPTTETSIVSIAFYYLPTTLEQYESLEELEATIELQIHQANRIYQNSGISVKFEAATMEPWPVWNTPISHQHSWPTASAREIYFEADTFVKILWNRGEFHANSADVLFIVDYRDEADSHCGWATIDTESGLQDSSTTHSYGMFRLGNGCGTDASVLAHELGHLLGAAHGYDEPLEASSHMGYGVQCGGKSTLMHPTFPKHDFISDPSKTEGGEACGYQDAADNVQLFRERIPLLAARVSQNQSQQEMDNSTILIATDNLSTANSNPSAPNANSYNSGGSLNPFAIVALLLLILISLTYQLVARSVTM